MSHNVVSVKSSAMRTIDECELFLVIGLPVSASLVNQGPHCSSSAKSRTQYCEQHQ